MYASRDVSQNRPLTGSQDSYIFPLRDTFFEGTPAKIPFAYKEVLEAEYKKKALTVTDYEGYVLLLELSNPLTIE